MSGIFKPITPKIDLNNSIESGLIFDSQLYEGSGVNTADLLLSGNGIITASGATWEKGPYGYDLNFSAAVSRVNWTTDSSVNSLSAGFTIETLVLARSAGGGNLGRLFQKTSGTSDTGTAWSLKYTTTQLQFTTGFATTPKVGAITKAPDSLWHHIVVTCSNLSSISSGTIIIYIDGISQTLVTDQAGVGAIATDNANLYMGNRSDAIRNLDGKISYGRIWNRALSATEALNLSENPWRIYVQPNLVNRGIRPHPFSPGLAR